MGLKVKRDAPNSQLPLLPALQSEALSAAPPSLPRCSPSLCGLTTTCARRRGGGGGGCGCGQVVRGVPLASCHPPSLPPFPHAI